jgi:hypothetical protein
VIACDLDVARLRLVGHARRPWVAVLGAGQDRYAVGTLPFLGAQNAVRTGTEALERLVRVLDPEEAAALAEQLPALRPLLSESLELGAGTDAALAGALGRPDLIAVAAGRAMLADARAHAVEDPRRRVAALAAAAVAGYAAMRAPGGRVGRAAAGYGAAVALVQAAHRRHGPPGPGR